MIIQQLAEANRPVNREFSEEVMHMNLTAATEGKEYIMQDGDVVEYYFNVSKSSK